MATLYTKDGTATIYDDTVPCEHPWHRLEQLHIKIRGEINIDTWFANRNARSGAARQDGRPVGFVWLSTLEKATPSQRKKILAKLMRVDRDNDFYH